jgi:hypothetical protein
MRLLVFAGLLALAAARPCSVSFFQSTVVIDNGFVSVTFDTARPSLSTIAADWFGAANYTVVTVSPGLVLEREDGSGDVHSSAVQGAGSPVGVDVIANSSVFGCWLRGLSAASR